MITKFKESKFKILDSLFPSVKTNLPSAFLLNCSTQYSD
ncbi:hypothetical protein GM3708_1593 [Geminocystis sp. NIES-3708]|nr:hypothetical protein GM3708_1593 [Geminocystis sp. NIES-3708]